MKFENEKISNEASIANVLLEHYTPSLQKLINEDAFKKIARITQYLPLDFCSLFGYEIQLSKTEKNPDFQICISNYEAFKRVICNDNQGALTGIFHEESALGLKRFALAWSDEIKQKINNIWFEIDYEDISNVRLKSNYFFGPKPSCNMLEVLLLTQEIFQLLYDKNVAPSTLKFLLECFVQMQGRGFISQIGMMNARNDESLRLFIQKIAPSDLLPYLKRIGYQYAEDTQLAFLVRECCNLSSHTDLDLDILERPGENIGLECYFESVDKALIFLEKILEINACTYENYLYFKEHLIDMKFDSTQSFQPFFHHFKIAYKPNVGVFSKAYLGYAVTHNAHKIIKTKPINISNYEKV